MIANRSVLTLVVINVVRTVLCANALNAPYGDTPVGVPTAGVPPAGATPVDEAVAGSDSSRATAVAARSSGDTHDSTPGASGWACIGVATGAVPDAFVVERVSLVSERAAVVVDRVALVAATVLVAA